MYHELLANFVLCMSPLTFSTPCYFEVNPILSFTQYYISFSIFKKYSFLLYNYIIIYFKRALVIEIT